MTVTRNRLASGLPATAFAFCGYEQKNLGRTPELLAHGAYGPVIEDYLEEASAICAEVTGRRADLKERVRRRRETSLQTYHEAVALVIAVELAQLRLLRDLFGIDYHDARMAFGFSLGEIAAVVAGGAIGMREALRIPLSLAEDCSELAKGVTLGVLFSRTERLPWDDVQRICARINKQGRGVIDVSTHLSPYSFLIFGQGDTLARFADMMRGVLPASTHLRKQRGHWPPMHTRILWERAVPDRACFMLNTLEDGVSSPRPPVFSLVTGALSYNDYNAGDILCKWTDHPQLLWSAIEETFAAGMQTVIHVGPAPSLIPAAFRRLTGSIEAGTGAGKALKGVVCHPWLRPLLPRRSSLLCAPLVAHVMLEDWLLGQPSAGPAGSHTRSAAKPGKRLPSTYRRTRCFTPPLKPRAT